MGSDLTLEAPPAAFQELAKLARVAGIARERGFRADHELLSAPRPGQTRCNAPHGHGSHQVRVEHG